MSQKKDEYLRIEVAGKDGELWKKTKRNFIKSIESKIIEAIDRFMNTIIDEKENSTIGDELKKYPSALLDFGLQKLHKPGLDNKKIIAEVEFLYSQTKKENAEASRIKAQAEAIRLDTQIKKLVTSLALTKVMLAGEEEDEGVLFIKQINDFLKTINDIYGGKQIDL